MKYLLDSNICIYLINNRPAHVSERLISAGQSNVGISALAFAEMAFGAAKSTQPKTRQKLIDFVRTLTVLPWPEKAVWHYARTRLALESAGRRISEMDLLIASHALAEDLVVVTNNTREFERVEGLKLENWV